jgi:hypothetical protein
MRIKSVVVAGVLSLGLAVFAAGAMAQGKPAGGDEPTPIARGAHISGVARYQPKAAAAGAASPASCSAPGSGNFRTDCNSSGRPVNETWVTRGPDGTYYAGANDYNSYNAQGQDGFYWSANGSSWNDAGPIDVFPHNNNYAAGDPGLAVDANGVVYYSSLFFAFNNCSVGGVELLRRDPSTGSWSYYQIATDSQSQFQDKPAIALSGANVYVSWTQFGSCSGSGVTSPIKVAVLPQGASSQAASTILSVPGSTYSQGSSIASDGAGGFWVAWEEWPSATSSNGSIRLAHYTGSTWATLSNGNTWQTISETGFADLPSPLPGFQFRDNSFPALTVTTNGPAVAWTSYDPGSVGRAWLWTGGTPTMVSNSGGSQFFPSIAPDGSGSVYVAYSQVNSGTSTYDQWLWHAGTATKVSTASSNPSQDAFFSGQFIGDYNGMVFDGTGARPIWTDIRGPDPSYPGWEMDSMIAAPAAVVTRPSAPTLTASDGTGSVNLSWTKPSDGGSAILFYNIYRATSPGGEGSTPYKQNVSGTTYTDTGVSNGTTYYYKVTAVNSVGEGLASNEASATPQTGSLPAAPALTGTPARGKGVQLTWTESDNSVTSYTVYRSLTDAAGSFSQLASTTSKSYKDTNTTKRTTYWYYVTAHNSAGESLPSTTVQVRAT